MIMAIGTPILRYAGRSSWGSTVATVTFSPTTTIQAGNRAVILSHCLSASAPSSPTYDVTDSLGNVWINDLTTFNVTTTSLNLIAYSDITRSITSGDSITVFRPNPRNSTNLDLVAYEVSGLGGTRAILATNSGTGTSYSVGPVGPLGQGNQIAFAFWAQGVTVSPTQTNVASGWTALTGTNTLTAMYQITNSITPITASETSTSASWDGALVTYQGARRLPVVGADSSWGALLNDFIQAPRNADGTLTNSVVDFQYYTTSGTWTKPQSADFVRVVCIGSGGGGGGGNTGASQSGASGGGGGAVTITDLRAADLTSIVTVTVGPGGAGGAAGANGSDGIATTFGAYAKAGGGGGGLLGASSIQAGAGASSLNSAVNVTPGNPSSSTAISGQGATTTAGFAGNNSEWGGASGGGGNIGGIRNGGSSIFGGPGGGSGAQSSGGNLAGGIGGATQAYTSGGGAAGGIAGTNAGSNGIFTGPFCGQGGGGGGSNGTAGANGGTGGIGAGGGGGGSGSSSSGSGGNGGPGRCYIISW